MSSAQLDCTQTVPLPERGTEIAFGRAPPGAKLTELEGGTGLSHGYAVMNPALSGLTATKEAAIAFAVVGVPTKPTTGITSGCPATSLPRIEGRGSEPVRVSINR